jgi:DNA-binding transcriptional ArsR family regulator
MSKKKIEERIIKQLNSEDFGDIMHGINEIRVHGNHLYIGELVKVLRNNSIPEVQREIAELFNDLHDNEAIVEIMREIKSSVNEKILHILVSSCWQSPLDYSEYISDFVDLAVDGDYQCTIEAISVIENILMQFEIDSLTISNQIYKINEKILKTEQERQPLLAELLKILKEKKG